MVVALWPLARSRWLRVPLVLFPLAMAFTLVYGGEHYVIDILAGWAASVSPRSFRRRGSGAGPAAPVST